MAHTYAGKDDSPSASGSSDRDRRPYFHTPSIVEPEMCVCVGRWWEASKDEGIRFHPFVRYPSEALYSPLPPNTGYALSERSFTCSSICGYIRASTYSRFHREPLKGASNSPRHTRFI